METLKQKTARGLFWGGMNTMVQQVIGLLFGIILGRLLAPSDYGMMAIISVFSLVAVAAMLLWHALAAPLLRYRLALFLKDILPFALAAASLCTWAATAQVLGLWLRLAARVALAAALYYSVMRVAGAHILEECMQFLKGKR